MNSLIQRARRLRMPAVLYWCALSAGCHAAEVPPDWKTECIGHYQLSLPGEVEVALTTMRKLYKPNDTPDAHLYADGESAPYTDFNGMEITAEVPPSEFEALKRLAIADNVKGKEALFQKAKSIDDREERQRALSEAMQSKPLALKDGNKFGWAFSKGGFELYQFHNGHIFYHEISPWRKPTPEEEIARGTAARLIDRSFGQAQLDTLLNTFQARKLYELPSTQGTCVPYGFMPDDGKNHRKVVVMMRLKEHPDVEIYFEDDTAPVLDPKNPGLSPRGEISYFLARRNMWRIKEVHLGFPAYREVKLDGREGEYAFAEIRRPDNSKDYGYVAYVKGDGGAAVDTPNLMLYVIRTAALAKGTPVSAKELKDIAQKIAASVKRHH